MGVVQLQANPHELSPPHHTMLQQTIFLNTPTASV